MPSAFFLRLVILFFLAPFFLAATPVPEEGNESRTASLNECLNYSDTFDTYNPERWRDVLIYSENRGAVAVEKGRMMLQTLEALPAEIQLYSLFLLQGDFDVQIDYHMPAIPELEFCRFNAGIVFQTPDDELSYKCYISRRPGKSLIFRARLDQFGEKKLEKLKGASAPHQGTLRITRTRQTIAFFHQADEGLQLVHQFETRCKEKLRLRLKLQTGDEETRLNACRSTIYFDNFIIHKCDAVVNE